MRLYGYRFQKIEQMVCASMAAVLRYGCYQEQEKLIHKLSSALLISALFGTKWSQQVLLAEVYQFVQPTFISTDVPVY